MAGQLLRLVAPDPIPAPQVWKDSRKQHRAAATVTARNTAGEPFSVLVFVILWPERMLACTGTADVVGSVWQADMEEMFQSISILPPRRGFFGRR